jgi:serralysin
MCNICSAFRPYQDGCDYVSLNSNAPVVETEDAAQDISTAYAIEAGQLFQGEIHSVGNRDWVRVDLEEGVTYEVDLKGVASGVGTLADPVMALYNSSGTYLTGNDDGGAGNESHLSYTPLTSGTYYLMARGYASSTGTYHLSVTPNLPPPPVGTLDELATYLTDTYWTDTGSVAHSFDTAPTTTITVDITGLTAEGQQLARWAMEAWEAVAKLTFNEVTSGAQITFDDASAGASAGATIDGDGNILSASVNIGTQWLVDHGTQLGSYGFQTYLHELGHVLGLGHQGDYNLNATYGVDAGFANDSWQMSVMSYFSQTENTAITATEAEAVTTMMADVVAIQSIYGKATGVSLTGGATTYGVGHSLGTSWLGKIFDAQNGSGSSADVEAGPFAMTIYDRNGRDLIDFSNDTSDQVVNLTHETISDVYGATGNLIIARKATIEDYRAGSGDDEIYGNWVANEIDGNGGNDTIDGGRGADEINGGAGDDMLIGGRDDDWLDGGAGADDLDGGRGTDWADYWGSSAGLTVDMKNTASSTGEAAGDTFTSIENLRGSMFNDMLMGTGQDNEIFGAQGNDVINGRNGADLIEGAGGRDNLLGSLGDDTLRGGDGADILNGGDDDDILTGGAGRDTIRFTEGADHLTDYDGDLLQFHTSLWGGGTKTKAELLSYGSVQGNDVVFDFGSGNTLNLDDYSDLAALQSSLGYF